MKILLIGDERDAGIILRALENANDDEITRCATGPDAIAELLSNKYDWAIVEGLSLIKHKKDIIRYFQSIDSNTQGNHTVKARINTDAAQSTRSTKCGVEWSKGGVLQLHCGLHDLIKRRTLPDPSALYDAGAIIFEYHAPCKKERWRNG